MIVWDNQITKWEFKLCQFEKSITKLLANIS